MKNWSFFMFMMSSLLICIPLAAYYAFAQVFVNHAGFQDPAFNMSFGQMSEIFFMLVMPLFFARLGVKWMLFAGMLAWVVRYGLFSLAADDGVKWMILFGIILHGICYDFFFVTGQIYVDKKAPRHIRGQAQGFLVLMTQGIGLGLGAQIMQRVVNANKQDSEILLHTYNWDAIWQFCAIFAGVIMVLFLVLFHDDAKIAAVSEGEVADAYAENVPEDPKERHSGALDG